MEVPASVDVPVVVLVEVPASVDVPVVVVLFVVSVWALVKVVDGAVDVCVELAHPIIAS